MRVQTVWTGSVIVDKQRQTPNMESSTTSLGQGIYGIAEAARLLRRPAAQVRRWANGYSYPRTYDRAERPPVLQTGRKDKDALSFRELIELFFVREYTSAGIQLTHVRDTAKAMAVEYGDHPFAAQKLLSDGKRLLAVSEYGLITPATCQIVAEFADQMVREFDFADDFVSLWRPKEGQGMVVVDPTRALGEPILADTGTPTRVLFKTFQLEQDFDRVADYYDLSPEAIRQAVDFELRFADAA